MASHFGVVLGVSSSVICHLALAVTPPENPAEASLSRRPYAGDRNCVTTSSGLPQSDLCGLFLASLPCWSLGAKWLVTPYFSGSHTQSSRVWCLGWLHSTFCRWTSHCLRLSICHVNTTYTRPHFSSALSPTRLDSFLFAHDAQYMCVLKSTARIPYLKQDRSAPSTTCRSS